MPLATRPPLLPPTHAWSARCVGAGALLTRWFNLDVVIADDFPHA